MTAFTDEWISHKLYNMKCTKKQKKDHIKHKTKMKNEYKTSFEHKKNCLFTLGKEICLDCTDDRWKYTFALASVWCVRKKEEKWMLI